MQRGVSSAVSRRSEAGAASAGAAKAWSSRVGRGPWGAVASCSARTSLGFG